MTVVGRNGRLGPCCTLYSLGHSYEEDGIVTLIWRMLRALCGGDGAEHRWLAVVDYLVAENRVLRQELSASGRRLHLNDEQRRDLAILGRRLKPALRRANSIRLAALSAAGIIGLGCNRIGQQPLKASDSHPDEFPNRTRANCLLPLRWRRCLFCGAMTHT